MRLTLIFILAIFIVGCEEKQESGDKKVIDSPSFVVMQMLNAELFADTTYALECRDNVEIFKNHVIENIPENDSITIENQIESWKFHLNFFYNKGLEANSRKSYSRTYLWVFSESMKGDTAIVELKHKEDENRIIEYYLLKELKWKVVKIDYKF